jgi:hypothetical protein
MQIELTAHQTGVLRQALRRIVRAMREVESLRAKYPDEYPDSTADDSDEVMEVMEQLGYEFGNDPATLPDFEAVIAALDPTL